ncbi:hypothetical protein ACW7GX_01040 [Aeromonas hydrophila]|uniref:hypothetical protein n=1 Tax=Aeromonas hydrophila TaxID=644 RepID=UPI00207C6C86|nr:hypothetical protein [Aeromonas hydrophila]MCO4210995.1 hypothetical protein [Aeromonas hydrophila]HDX8441845.1 hypothetical protein [Aeromonas hydrophila]HDX8633109.1 hypothetical protein [Aeromonas hydrophila]
MDLEFVHKLTSDFVESLSVTNKFQLIENLIETPDKRVHDYEKWLQIEFAMFLYQRQNSEVSDWGREKNYLLDRRLKSRIKHKRTTTVDFWLKRKYQKYPGEILIEFKRAKSINSCVKQMIDDGALLRKINKSEHTVRSFWMVGFHPSETESHTVFDKAFKQEAKLNEWVNDRKLKTERIEGTNLSFSIFTLYEI